MSPATRREALAWTRAIGLVAVIAATGALIVLVGLRNAGLI